MSRQVRQLMQQEIDRRGGSRSLYRGMMPRLVRQPLEGTPSRPVAVDTQGAQAI
jgi:hypothetical protein